MVHVAKKSTETANNDFVDRLAEWSKALVLGTSSRERGFKSHSGHSTKKTLFSPYLVFGCCVRFFFLVSHLVFLRLVSCGGWFCASS